LASFEFFNKPLAVSGLRNNEDPFKSSDAYRRLAVEKHKSVQDVMIGVAELFRGVFKLEVEDLTPHYITICLCCRSKEIN